jgi:hypothetical protein
MRKPALDMSASTIRFLIVDRCPGGSRPPPRAVWRAGNYLRDLTDPMLDTMAADLARLAGLSHPRWRVAAAIRRDLDALRSGSFVRPTWHLHCRAMASSPASWGTAGTGMLLAVPAAAYPRINRLRR